MERSDNSRPGGESPEPRETYGDIRPSYRKAGGSYEQHCEPERTEEGMKGTFVRKLLNERT